MENSGQTSVQFNSKSYHLLCTELQEVIEEKKGRRKLDMEGVVDICEQTFGYEFALFIAAIRASFAKSSGTEESASDFKTYADLLQKRLKYGLPSAASVLYFEIGFAERVIAQHIADEVGSSPTSAYEARISIRNKAEEISKSLTKFPSYFSNVLSDILAT